MRANAISVKQMEYKNAELVLIEFMSLQDYDHNNPDAELPRYEDFNLQEFHDFIADKISALDAFIDRYWWTRWPYKTKQE